VLLDYGGVVVHLLSPAARDYYKLEDLWSAGKVLLRLQ
jgi:ribosomal silencing factor RsfS